MSTVGRQSLGQAISQAGGIALARRLRGDTGRVWVFMSDGEFQEGQTWEAFAALAYYRLDNLGVYIDANGQQCDGLMDDVMNNATLTAMLVYLASEEDEMLPRDRRSLGMDPRTGGPRDWPQCRQPRRSAEGYFNR